MTPSLSLRVPVGTLALDPVTEDEVVARVFAALGRGEGGWISTPNVDILRRSAEDAEVRRLVGAADLVLADGAPVVWAARIGGRPLPERVAGSALLWSLSAAAARSGRGIYLLGGNPGVADRAAARLCHYAPDLRVTGTFAPPWGFESDPTQVDAIRERLVRADPDVVFVGLAYNDDDEQVRKFVRKYQVPYGVALDPEGRIFIDYGATGVPETFLIDREGRLTQKWIGPITAPRLNALIEPLVR